MCPVRLGNGEVVTRGGFAWGVCCTVHGGDAEGAVMVGKNWGCSGCRGLQQSTLHGGDAEVAEVLGQEWGGHSGSRGL